MAHREEPLASQHPHPAALVSAMSDEARRKTYAAIVLGAKTVKQVCVAAQLPEGKTMAAIERLISVGLLASEDDQLIVTDAFAAALERRDGEVSGANPAHMKQLKKFLRDGKLVSIPTARSKRLPVLDWLATMFEPADRYSEVRVNEILGKFHDDVAALRRYLVDEGFLTRDKGEYWRSGGTFEVD